jgi:Na+-driven multidrug efflux pump
LKILAPAVVVQFSRTFIFPLTASKVGLLLGTEAQAGFSLGSLVGNLTYSSIIAGTLMAADILMPRAFEAKDYEEMGILAIRSVIICGALLFVPLVPLFTSIE